ncbi:glycosyltransferase family 4 protein [Pseudarthrobacter sulfonivorans]|uniref:glycosyltransferase family 4 protein n=1 Tax=Pseudarthrobacter sulfonivorans TaxID=121292 RepID=UPI0028570ACC|nr:glycosyltransferase family 4 protein [Pseudarthrobacter sulfonivorans]MDR6414878.1 glycosyltransferase involved in cell wall biosynthesis [Pseudarthrobacter sulfonivorans]
MTKPHLRITILGLNYAPEPSGNAPYTTSLAEGLFAAGHSVHVVTGYPHYPEWDLRAGYTGWMKTEIINGVTVKRLRHHIPRHPTPLGRLHMELSFGFRLMFARWQKPDVVLVVSPALFSCALAILRIRLRPNRPAVGIWIQDLYSRGVSETGTGGRRSAQLATSLESTILNAADGVAAIHERFKRHMVVSLGVPENRVEVIRNWTHLPTSPTSGIAEMRTQLGWASSDIVVLHAGNMGKKQGLENVIEAARIAGARGSSVRFVLMGDGNQRRRLEELARDVPNITFVDPLPGHTFQVALAAADVLLVNELPGVKDMAVPSKLTSYFNAGVPVMAATDSDSVTAHEIETSGGGVRVDAAVPLALVETAESLAREPAIAARMVENALRFRHETLSESAAVAHYDEFITSLASSRGR